MWPLCHLSGALSQALSFCMTSLSPVVGRTTSLSQHIPLMLAAVWCVARQDYILKQQSKLTFNTLLDLSCYSLFSYIFGFFHYISQRGRRTSLMLSCLSPYRHAALISLCCVFSHSLCSVLAPGWVLPPPVWLPSLIFSRRFTAHTFPSLAPLIAPLHLSVGAWHILFWTHHHLRFTHCTAAYRLVCTRIRAVHARGFCTRRYSLFSVHFTPLRFCARALRRLFVYCRAAPYLFSWVRTGILYHISADCLSHARKTGLAYRLRTLDATRTHCMAVAWLIYTTPAQDSASPLFTFYTIPHTQHTHLSLSIAFDISDILTQALTSLSGTHHLLSLFNSLYSLYLNFCTRGYIHLSLPALDPLGAPRLLSLTTWVVPPTPRLSLPPLYGISRFSARPHVSHRDSSTHRFVGVINGHLLRPSRTLFLITRHTICTAVSSTHFLSRTLTPLFYFSPMDTHWFSLILSSRYHWVS